MNDLFARSSKLIGSMRISFVWTLLSLFILLFSTSCGQESPSAAITILDGTQVLTLTSKERIPASFIASAGLSLSPNDQVLYQGIVVNPDQSLPLTKTYSLQILRAFPLTLTENGQSRIIHTTSQTIGQALNEIGIELSVSDRLDPPVETPLTGPLEVIYKPATSLSISVDGLVLQANSSAITVGQALSEVGLPLQGLDYSLPAESAPLPADGRIRIIRVNESVLLVQKSLPYETEFQASADLELDRQDVLQAGEYGLSVSRLRIRYEDGKEVSRQTETESTARPPKKRLVGYGTKIVVRTTNIGGAPIEYWRSVKMYATSYSPCRSAPGRCYPSTASGKPVQKGVVAVVYRWYVYMLGQPIYIPSYGHATVEDVGGGIPGKYWIDLGYSDDDWQQWGEWVTVYFLTPVPANPLFVLN
jgi:uncharacterized protein YabE (DUF348 family)